MSIGLNPGCERWRLAVALGYFSLPLMMDGIVIGAVDAADAAKAFQYIGDESCQRCHREPVAVDKQPGQALERITLREFTDWNAHDQHRQAYAVLKTPQAQAMGQILGYRVDERMECLACHGGPPAIADLSAGRHSVIEAGLGCEACHGPASQYVTTHWQRDYWRKTPDVKSREGLQSVREPAVRAELCLSCHLGSVVAGKWVSHDMYAAGHPPIGSFEIEAFTAAMPSHGKPLSQKPAELRKQLAFREDDVPASIYIVTTSLVAAQMTSQNMVTLTSRGSLRSPQDPHAAEPPAWPDWAIMDCAACHHELRVTSWRELRYGTQTPGRPQLIKWPWQLYRNTHASAQTSEPLPPEPLARLIGVLQRQPFGNPKHVGAAAAQLNDDLQLRLTAVRSQPFDRAATVQLLRDLVHGAADANDYEAARQSGWGMQSLVRSLGDEHTGTGLGAAQWANISRLTDELGSVLDLRLGAQSQTKEPRNAQRLKAAEQFETNRGQREYQRLFKQLGQQLGQPSSAP